MSFHIRARRVSADRLAEKKRQGCQTEILLADLQLPVGVTHGKLHPFK